MKHGISARYAAMVAKSELERDGAQEAAIERLEALANALVAQELGSKGSALGWLFGHKTQRQSLRGVYIWGSVGRGKTMLMDLFYDGLAVKAKRRAHFHAFMADVHERIHAWRQKARAGEVKGSDPIAPVGQAIAAEAHVLCFDEFAVTDIADAMLLGRLFETLFKEGVTVVATSNRHPDELYKDGLNRSLFVPFIHMLEERLEVLKLEARTDYRMEKLAGAEVYLTGPDAEARLEAVFTRLTGGARWHPAEIEVKGRTITLPKAAQGVAMARFDDLCDQPLGAGDYLAIAQRYHTLVIAGVPQMDQAFQSAAKRFITLIDVLYDQNVKTIIAAAVPAAELYKGTRGPEVFEFERTVSRLTEMRSDGYLSRAHGRGSEVQGASATGIVET